MKKKLIGHIGVDAGQIVICDPCYIDSQWIKEDFKDVRIYRVNKDKMPEFIVDMGDMLHEHGIRFDMPLPGIGKSMNDLMKDGEAVEVPNEQTGRFSYDGCCKATQSKDQGGQLNFALGHAGAGVAVSSGYGDGYYPVYAHYNKEGRVSKVEIKFMED